MISCKTVFYTLVASIFLLISETCVAHNGNLVSASNADVGPLYYRICVLHAIPIRYYVEPGFSTIPIQLTAGGAVRFVNGDALVQRALEQWRSATVLPGQPATCSFERVNLSTQADLVFEARSTNFPPEVLGEGQIDSYRSGAGEARNTISVIPRRISAELRNRLPLFGDTPAQVYIDNYLTARLLHLTGHALGLDHPGFEASHDVLPNPAPNQDRIFFLAGDLAEAEWARPHIMMSDTFGYLLELEQHLGHTVVRDDIRPTEAENQAIRFYLVHDWVCPVSDVTTNTAVSLPISSSRCLNRPAWLGLPAMVNLLLQ
ncbi:zinc metalloprotease [Dyella flagellata]|uniref:hypothetical protein n=1 Tax=Dyella flagellata TaxID=1867833 RepID=UPI0024E06C0A|nr:hypothetical protein [Dyella flagellata]